MILIMMFSFSSFFQYQWLSCNDDGTSYMVGARRISEGIWPNSSHVQRESERTSDSSRSSTLTDPKVTLNQGLFPGHVTRSGCRADSMYGCTCGENEYNLQVVGVECICIGHEKRKEQQHLKQNMACPVEEQKGHLAELARHRPRLGIFEFLSPWVDELGSLPRLPSFGGCSLVSFCFILLGNRIQNTVKPPTGRPRVAMQIGPERTKLELHTW